MVFFDFEFSDSTRVFQKRQTNPYYQRLFVARGGYLTDVCSYGTLLFSSVYFYRKFNDLRLIFRLGWSGLMAYGLYSMVNELCIRNFGFYWDYVYLSQDKEQKMILLLNSLGYVLEENPQNKISN